MRDLVDQHRTDGDRRRRPRSVARVSIRLALLAVASMLLSSCYFLAVATDHEANSPDTRPWWCHSSGEGGHTGHGADLLTAEMPMEMPAKGMLSWTDCKAVSANFDAALGYAQQYPTQGDALDAGFTTMVPYATGMGTHLAQLGDFDITDPSFDPTAPVFAGTALDEVFDPNQPEFLQYDGNGRNAKLVGMSWYVRSEDGPPAGFAGTNDHWHVHPRLCFSDQMRFMGQNRSDASCEGAGGHNLYLDDYYMVHAWIVPGWDHRPDVFVNHHPCLQSSGPVTDLSAHCRQMIAHGN